MANEILDSELRVRIKEKDLRKFVKKSLRETKKPYSVFIRELICAYNDGKLRIIDNENKLSENFYVTE